MARTKPSANVAPRRGPICFDPNKPMRPTRRAVFGADNVELWGYPSRGGIVVLGNAGAADIEFLGWDPVNIPLSRDDNQEAEDEFCKSLLLLGAGWYDSEERYEFLVNIAENDEEALLQVRNGDVPMATKKERLWVRVGWPSGSTGFWVAEFDNTVFGPLFYEPQLPSRSGQVSLARNMDEKCHIIESLDGSFYPSIDDYDGVGFLRAWEHKYHGEIGPLVAV
ncbi:hypothetical protein PENSTE_c001G01363 [Penicillium steckii]|uniref:Uncharacterized protein n=1 Tax=Penicillium steckii TaxID=303698 RepID=A0A1V6U114_9EURO|nr:hypothetical protein PENSTE_c001G01363 [Penicillium steckii]